MEQPFCFPRTTQKLEPLKEILETEINEVAREERAWTMKEISDAKLDKVLIV